MSISSFVLQNYGLICCEGAEAEKFLQGQITVDVHQASSETALLSAYCDHKGRVLASFYFFKKKDQYFFCLPYSQIQVLLNELNKFAVFSNVTLSDVSKNYQIWAAIDYPLEHGIALPGIKPRFINLAPVATSTSGCENVQAKNLWQHIEIQSGIVVIEPKTSLAFTPHQLGYQNIPAINLKKGCYRGQEIIARMHYLGKLKQHLFLCQIQASHCDLMAEVHSPELGLLGQVVQYLEQKPNNYLVLASLMDQALSLVDKLFIKDEPNSRVLSVQSPFQS